MNRKRLWPLASLTCLGLLLVSTWGAEPPPPVPAPDFTNDTPVPVVRIVDGDTIVIQLDGQDQKVRLIGVDTPETVDPRKPVQHYGKEASAFLTNLLKGESVYLRYDQTKLDKYGRLLAYLYRAPDGLFVNLEIVRQGYGPRIRSSRSST